MVIKKCNMKILVSTLFILFLFLFFSKDSRGDAYSPNVHWVFCIDTSGSMKTKGHMDLLRFITEKINHGFIDVRKNIIKTGDRITIFSFDQDVRLEATALYQTENDILPIRSKLVEMNKRNGSLTFISEAVVQAIDFIGKYNQFFHTNALYVFTDGKSEPYSSQWSKERIEERKKRDAENFKKISLSGKDHGLNVWLGVLKWEAFEDAKYLVGKMGKGGHLVDLTDFNRLSLEKALIDFSETVRPKLKIFDIKDVDLGTIPYGSASPYQKRISLDIQTEKVDAPPSIMGRIIFDPDNPSEIDRTYPIEVKTTEDKMVLNFKMAEYSGLKPGTYKGKLDLFPSYLHFGALEIEPSQFNVEFKKTGFLSFYVWRVLIVSFITFLSLSYLVSKIKRKMPIKV
jgi:hypothetical protein